MTRLPLPVFLALAHLRRRRSQNLVTVLGVAIGVMVLTGALSLTNGFVGALVEATIKAQPHIDLRAWDASSGGAPRDPALEARLSGTPGVVGWGPYAFAPSLASRRAQGGSGGGIGFAYVYGVEPAREADALGLGAAERELLRRLPPDGLLLGRELARNIGALEGDTVILTTGANLSDSSRRGFRVVGTFRTGNYLIDSQFAFAQLPAIQALLGRPGLVTGYHLRLSDPDAAPGLGPTLVGGTRFTDYPWQNLNASLIGQLSLQRRVISVVLLLIVVVAAFGIVNVLVLTVFEKTPEIAILRAMGASSRTITGVFLVEGLVLGVAGLVLGNLLGFALSYYFKLRPFTIPGDLYFISALPVDIRATDFLWVSVASLFTTLLAALVPARRAAAIEPARIIR